MTEPHVLVAGAGHAAGQFAATLRQFGFTGAITLVGDETLAPYQRPPLSKGWITGKVEAAALLLRPTSFYEAQNITLRLGTSITTLDRAGHTATLADGEVLPWDIFVIATGARARTLPLPGADLAGIFYLRGADDADAIKLALENGTSLAVIGGGYIGLEVAASARGMGLNVTLFERESRLLARVASAPLSGFMLAQHSRKGVNFEFEAHVEAITGTDGKAAGVQLADGRTIAADVILIGVGAIPNDDLARQAGLECDRGIVVDEDARTADHTIYAIGDVAYRPMPVYGRMHRLESVPSAMELARQAAAAITGKPRPAAEVPWFWSDQYDLKLQMAGIPFDTDLVVHRGDLEGEKLAVFHLKDGHLQAVEAVNAVAEFVAGRRLIGSGQQLSPDRLADPNVSMKDVAA